MHLILVCANSLMYTLSINNDNLSSLSYGQLVIKKPIRNILKLFKAIKTMYRLPMGTNTPKKIENFP